MSRCPVRWIRFFSQRRPFFDFAGFSRRRRLDDRLERHRPRRPRPSTLPRAITAKTGRSSGRGGRGRGATRHLRQRPRHGGRRERATPPARPTMPARPTTPRRQAAAFPRLWELRARALSSSREPAASRQSEEEELCSSDFHWEFYSLHALSPWRMGREVESSCSSKIAGRAMFLMRQITTSSRIPRNSFKKSPTSTRRVRSIELLSSPTQCREGWPRRRCRLNAGAPRRPAVNRAGPKTA